MATSLVVGGCGFIGANLVRYLTSLGEHCIVVDNGSGLGRLRPLPKSAKVFKCDVKELQLRPKTIIDNVFYLAAHVAGITYNLSNQSLMLDKNLSALLGLRQIYELRPRCVVYFSTACVYPADSPVPTPEEWGEKGIPEITNLGYGIAKRTGEALVRLLHKETGVNTVIVRPFNSYGPWDYFDLKNAHFIPAVIHQMIGGSDIIEVFGGLQSRAFVYVDDIIRCVWRLANIAKGVVTVNVGHSNMVTIREATRAIERITGYSGKVRFITGPIGYPKRGADSSLLEHFIGPVNWTAFEKGVQQTVAWYRDWRGGSQLTAKQP